MVLKMFIFFALLAATLMSFNVAQANAVVAISQDLTGKISCNTLGIVVPGWLNLAAVGEVGDLGLDGSYSISSNGSLASSGEITNITHFDPSSSFVFMYRGQSVNCSPNEITFNSTIGGSCGQNVRVEFKSEVMAGIFRGDVHCMK